MKPEVQLVRLHQGKLSALCQYGMRSLVQANEQRDNCHNCFQLVFHSFGEAISIVLCHEL